METTAVLDAFVAVCRGVNRTLEVLHIYSGKGKINSIDQLNDQELGDYLPIDAKRAVLSVRHAWQSRQRSAMDSFVVARIFAFAASKKRRRVVWHHWYGD